MWTRNWCMLWLGMIAMGLVASPGQAEEAVTPKPAASPTQKVQVPQTQKALDSKLMSQSETGVEPAQPDKSVTPKKAGVQDDALVMFDFEEGPDGWVIPDWAKTSLDYVGDGLAPSKETASHGNGSLQLMARFPGGKWTGAYAEIEMPVTDWGNYSQLAVDVYLPANAPKGLKSRVILTVGESWQWTEMNRPVELKAGRWTTITTNLKPGSMDWKFFPDEAFRHDVRRVGVRIESDKTPVYQGPIHVDHVRLIK